MASTISAIPFAGTEEQEKQLQAVIQKYKGTGGALMPVLQGAQEIYGYLPIEVQKMVADGLGLPLSEVYGVSTFYAQFSLNPKGENKISVCLGTACYVRGAEKVLDEFQRQLEIKIGETTSDGLFSLDCLRCVGACGLAPVVTIGGKVYGRITPEKVRDILSEYYIREE